MTPNPVTVATSETVDQPVLATPVAAPPAPVAGSVAAQPAVIPAPAPTPVAAPAPAAIASVAVATPGAEAAPVATVPTVSQPVAAQSRPVTPRQVAELLPAAPVAAAFGAALVDPETAERPAIWQPVVTPAVVVSPAIAGTAVPQRTAVVIWPDAPEAMPEVRVFGESLAPVRPPLAPAAHADLPSVPAMPVPQAARPAAPVQGQVRSMVDAPVSPAWRSADDQPEVPVFSADAPETGPAPVAQTPVTPNERSVPMVSPIVRRSREPFVDAPVAPWSAALSLSEVAPAMAAPTQAPVRRAPEAPVRPGVVSAPTMATESADGVRGDVSPEMIAAVIENAATGRMMVGAWQTYQQSPVESAPVRETGTVVPPLPVRLLNLALNVAQAGRRLDAPLLDGALPVPPRPVDVATAAVPAAATAARLPLQPTPIVDADAPIIAAPATPPTAGAEGGRVSQSPVEPVAAKPAPRPSVGIPVDAPVVAFDDGFANLVAEGTDDLDILADWPEEEGIDNEIWPDEVSPEAAAEFLTALGNVVAGQTMPLPAMTADDAPAVTEAPRPEPRRTLPGPLPLQAHMDSLQSQAFVSGTPDADAPVSPAAPGRPTDSAAPIAPPVRDVAPQPASTAPVSGNRPAPAIPAIPGVVPAVPAPPAPVQAEQPVDEAETPTAPVRPEPRRPAAGRRAAEPSRVRVDAADDDLPIGLIPKEMVQPAAFEVTAPEPSPAPIVAPAAASADGGGNSDPSGDQRQNRDPQAVPAPEAPAGFVNPLAFSAQSVLSNEGGEAETEVAVEGVSRRPAAPTPTTGSESEAIGPISVRSAEAAVSRAPEAATRPTEPTPIMNTAGMTSNQLVDAVNDGAPLHFSQFQNLVQGIVANKPFVDKTVEVVLNPEGLGRIRLEVSLVDGGTAIKIAIATQSQAALGVFEAYGKNMQQIAQSQGYTLKEFDVKMTDRPIRSDSRGGQAGNDAAGQRQGRRKRRGRDDDGTV
jgi:hypothetical protein